MESCTISVLISVYKSENAKHLSRALHSIWFEQTLKPSEIVLIEDGPLGKELLDVINCWKENLGNKLQILQNPLNLGLTKSLNRGLKVISSEYIARMDSDDIALPDRIRLQWMFLQNHSDIDVVGGAIQEFCEDSSGIQYKRVRRYPLTNEDIRNTIHKASPLAHPTVMIRRSLFEKGLKYDERFRTCQDLALWFDVLCQNGKIANIADVVLLFRREQDVFRRRKNYQNIKNEFKIYTRGIYRLNGLLSFKYIYPFARFLFRLMPVSVVSKFYDNSLRNRLIEKK